jgi:hypothetical protein
VLSSSMKALSPPTLERFAVGEGYHHDPTDGLGAQEAEMIPQHISELLHLYSKYSDLEISCLFIMSDISFTVDSDSDNVEHFMNIHLQENNAKKELLSIKQRQGESITALSPHPDHHGRPVRRNG